MNALQHEDSWASLERIPDARRRAPRLGASRAKQNFTPSSSWSTKESTLEHDIRAARTSAALLGIHPSGNPGLEVLVEEEERIHDYVREHADEMKERVAVLKQ
jgi:hypothetical protein